MKIIANKYEAKDILKFIRQNTGLTQEEFGKSINKKRNTIECYEIGRRNYTFNFLIQIANNFNLKITILDKKTCFLIDVNNYQSNKIILLIREYKELSKEEFSKKVNKSLSTIKNYEYNHRNCYFYFILEIAKKFDLTIIIEDIKK